MRAASFFVMGALLFNTSALGAVTYDAVQEFSTNNNPSGVWSYGYVTALDGPFSLATNKADGAWITVCYPPNEVIPYTRCGTRISIQLGPSSPDGTRSAPSVGLFNNPFVGSTPSIPVLRFTAPTGGNYKVNLTIAGIAGAPPAKLFVRVNDVEVDRTVLMGAVFPVIFTNYTTVLTLSSGDRVDFVGSDTQSVMQPENHVFLTGRVELSGPAGIAVWSVPAAGLFTNSVSVALLQTSTTGAIRYTLNGTNPSSNSDTYTNPITITNTTEVRAAVFDGGAVISQVLTSSFARVYAINDGIPAGWRQQYFGPGYLTDPRVTADADPDGDLSTNWEEYLAGTNPLDNTSGFRANVSPVPKLEFGSQSNRVYRILRGQRPDTNVTAIATVTATNNVTTYVDPSPISPGSFYLIELLP